MFGREQRMKQQFLEAGRLLRTHGVRGELVLEPWADSPGFLADIRTLYFDREGQRPVEVLAAREHKGRLLVRLRGVARWMCCGAKSCT